MQGSLTAIQTEKKDQLRNFFGGLINSHLDLGLTSLSEIIGIMQHTFSFKLDMP